MSQQKATRDLTAARGRGGGTGLSQEEWWSDHGCCLATRVEV